MIPTAEWGRALAIGNTAIDEFYRNETLERTCPGGTAFNVASWFDHYGFQSYLCSTLGRDFPAVDGIDTSLCIEVDADSPRCRVTLNDSTTPEERSWRQGSYRYRPLGAVEDRFDVVVLTSGRAEYEVPFDTARAGLKAFVLDPLVGSYCPTQLAEYVAEAEYLFVNDAERRALEGKLETPARELPDDFGLRGVLETEAERVRLYEPGKSVPSLAVETIDRPVDTTGAGDAFAATFVSEVSAGATHEAAIRTAHAAAVRTVTRVGACPVRPR